MPRHSPASDLPTPAHDALTDSGLHLSRRFLGWDQSLVQAAADHLAADWSGSGALDLSECLIVVPTRHASRRLREALAIHAAKTRAAVIPPLTVTPDFLTSPERIPDISPAGQVETLLLWASELLKLDLEDYRHLFPVDPVERSFTWALKTAGDLLQVRETLNENGLSLADASRILDGSEMEPERWRDLARLERTCVHATEAGGLTDWQVARRLAASHGSIPPAVKRIVIAGVLDPSTLAVQALQRHAMRLPVEVLIHAPEKTHAFLFDTWGRPVADAWLRSPIDIPNPESTIHQGSSPSEQAAVTMELLAPYPNPGAVVAIGIADTEISAPLEKTLAVRGLGAYDPGGKPMGTHGVFLLLRLLSRLSATRSFTVAAELIRCPDVLETIRRKAQEKTNERPSLTHLLTSLDDLAVKALPDTLDDAIELSPQHLKSDDLLIGLRWMAEALANLEGPSFGSALADFLADVFSAREFRSNRPQDAVFSAIADQIARVLDALEGPAVGFFPSALTVGGRLELLLRVLEDQVFYPERAERDIDLQGWLELLWEDAPHVIVTGMNDGKVPESIMAHSFLPDSARRALGLRNNDTRFARDACLMTTLIEQRRLSGGRVDFIFGRVGAGAEPLRPSRLLFQCPDVDLPARTLHFFKKPKLRSDPMPWKLAWRLKPEPLPDTAPIFHKLSVTMFKDYLTCPFRFYLKHGLGMKSVDTSRTEMDPMEFGNLLHHVLEQFGKDGQAATSTDPNAIREELLRLLDLQLHATYGSRLSVPVTIQRESARQRLSWWAEYEAKARADGWEIALSETRISTDSSPWKLMDMIVSGKVDRVELHPEHGARLMDFKTYSPTAAGKGSSKTVEEYHLTKLKRTENADDFPKWMITQNSFGETSRWTDLQLPLYHLAMERHFPGRALQTAYATLGKTKSDIALDAWPALTGELLRSARECAEGVITSIRNRVFWPPAEKLSFGDDFGHLFLGDPLEAVDPGELIKKEVA